MTPESAMIAAAACSICRTPIARLPLGASVARFTIARFTVGGREADGGVRMHKELRGEDVAVLCPDCWEGMDHIAHRGVETVAREQKP